MDAVCPGSDVVGELYSACGVVHQLYTTQGKEAGHDTRREDRSSSCIPPRKRRQTGRHRAAPLSAPMETRVENSPTVIPGVCDANLDYGNPLWIGVWPTDVACRALVRAALWSGGCVRLRCRLRGFFWPMDGRLLQLEKACARTPCMGEVSGRLISYWTVVDRRQESALKESSERKCPKSRVREDRDNVSSHVLRLPRKNLAETRTGERQLTKRLPPPLPSVAPVKHASRSLGASATAEQCASPWR